MVDRALRKPIPTEEPSLRIGIILPEDRCEDLVIDLGGSGWTLYGPMGPRSASGTLRFVREGDGLSVWQDSAEVGRSATWTLASAESEPEHCAVVRGAAAGRGFHWRRKIDVALAHSLVVSARDGQIMLVNEMPIERYLLGVVTAEMSGECPIAFLEAQAVVARSWTLSADRHKHAGLQIDFCNDDCCQRFQGFAAASKSARRAIANTRGVVLRHRSGAIVEASYSKACGGIVEAPEFVWGRRRPGLSALVDAPTAGTTASFYGKLEKRIEEFVAGPWLSDCDAYLRATADSGHGAVALSRPR